MKCGYLIQKDSKQKFTYDTKREELENAAKTGEDTLKSILEKLDALVQEIVPEDKSGDKPQSTPETSPESENKPVSNEKDNGNFEYTGSSNRDSIVAALDRMGPYKEKEVPNYKILKTVVTDMQEMSRIPVAEAASDALDKIGDAIKNLFHFDTGGLATFTGPAWLDGTRAKPEMVLNSTDTKNFIVLKDVLSDAMSGISSKSESTVYGNSTYEININVDHLNNDYDVDKVAKRVEKIITQDASYRNVTTVRKFR